MVVVNTDNISIYLRMAFLLFTVTVSTILVSSLVKAIVYDTDPDIIIPDEYFFYPADQGTEYAFHFLRSLGDYNPTSIVCVTVRKRIDICSRVSRVLKTYLRNAKHSLENVPQEDKNYSEGCIDITVRFVYTFGSGFEDHAEHVAYKCEQNEVDPTNPAFYITSFGLEVSRIFVLTTDQSNLAATLPLDKHIYLYGLAVGGALPPSSGKKIIT